MTRTGLVLANPLRIDGLYMSSLPSGAAATGKLTLPPSIRLAIWDGQYVFGMRTLPPFALFGLVSLATAGHLAGKDQGAASQWVGSKAWYWTAAALAFAHVPFTVCHLVRDLLCTKFDLLSFFQLLFIKPTNQALFNMRRSSSLNDSASEKAQLEKLFKTWTRLHLVRVTTAVTAFGLSIAAAVA